MRYYVAKRACQSRAGLARFWSCLPTKPASVHLDQIMFCKMCFAFFYFLSDFFEVTDAAVTVEGIDESKQPVLLTQFWFGCQNPRFY